MVRTVVFIVLVMIVSSFVYPGEAIDLSPKLLTKDLSRLFEREDISLINLEIPDSLSNNILLDNGRIYISRAGNETLGFVYVGRVYSCRAGGCALGDERVITAEQNDEDIEYFDYYIVLEPGLIVKKVRVFNYQATHGEEVCGSGWLKQFMGYHGEKKLEYGKNIDAISGATISANAITYNVQEAVRYLELLKTVLGSYSEGKAPIATK